MREASPQDVGGRHLQNQRLQADQGSDSKRTKTLKIRMRFDLRAVHKRTFQTLQQHIHITILADTHAR